MNIRNVALAASLAAMLIACGKENRTGQPETDTTGTEQSVQQTTDSATATTTGASGGTLASMTNEDKEFVSKAGMGGLAEVQMGNLALQKASNADVKAFAQRMVTDHSTANAELAQLATAKGLALPTELGGEHKDAFDHLNSLSGAEFDKAYMKHMVEDHEKDVAEFDKASTSATDADVKGWAGKTLPTLKEHLEQAKSTASKV
jgi:putative membrane protein